MAPRRFVQNFSRRHAIVVSNDERVATVLMPTLQRLGLGVECRATGEEAVDLSTLPLQPCGHVIFVDGDLARTPIIPCRGDAGEMPAVPVVGLVGVEAPSRLKTLLQAGATAFLAKPVHGGAVFSALSLAVNEHARKSELFDLVDAHEQRRRQRRFVIKALVQLMAERGLDDEAAFALLRKQSMHERLSIEAYCQSVVQRSATIAEGEPETPPSIRFAK
ncbi:ANTAR domain-containing response regulator [Aurantimonas endophytica]|uniref:AmiR/NasT family two-component response regulator n=1 Tax=Aurantimonas endophytica TaxID=1522175 RepID=A0A7W6HDW0_9HYPH|nr:ANTAR domain-containing protein [Aurantimonas endophytica]MBB4003434.1 AmiR/NasT family two-component response regulator [Aurantimonas endophytica]MCO6404295.1 ANTAR domain-containing protein [Aurantimonas endophytica]